MVIGNAIRLAAIFAAAAQAQQTVGRYSVFEAVFPASGSYQNPYTAVTADAVFSTPDGTRWRAPMFWDGGNRWVLRVSPNRPGKWTFRISSNDPGLNGKSGNLTCAESGKAGGIRTAGHHFQRENGGPFFFLGDTAWGYFTDNPEEKLGRAQQEIYIKARAAQGFTVIHSMLLSESGDGNRNGPPWKDIAAEHINPDYFREADSRIAFANANGLTAGIALAWGNKGRQEKYSWGHFPTAAARHRFARYVAARYGAYDTYFLVSGEWHAELRRRPGGGESEIFQEFVEIGNALSRANAHRRMVGIHPMTAHGSVREFAATPWMSFADYQQNYQTLNARALQSRSARGPVVNGEYGYLLRDQDGDGSTDKDNSHSVEDMRHASWDLVMGGAYLVTGFGTTYFGGRRDPGPFDPVADKNREWEKQIGYLKRFFTGLEWWRLEPSAQLITASVARDGDWIEERPRRRHPPQSTYWAMTIPGETVVGYIRGLMDPVQIETGDRRFRVRQYNPRTGEFTVLPDSPAQGRYSYRPPDKQDWLVVLDATE